ncbi:MAG: hypothetical protein U1E65_04880 [Myxococcota bacterium]
MPKVDKPAAAKAPPPPPPQVPTKAVDVTNYTKAEYDALPPKYKTAVTEAKAYFDANFSKMSPPPQVLVVASKSNGDLPVTVIVPPGAKAPLTVQTHYHGDRAGSVRGENAATDTIAKNVRAGSKTVYVMPEAADTNTPTNWGNVADINKTTSEALTAATLKPGDVGRTIVSGHSAGGRAIAAHLTNPKATKLKADEVVLQDALYWTKDTPTYDRIKDNLPNADVKKVTMVHSDDEGMGERRGPALAKDLDKVGIDHSEIRVAHHPQAAGVIEDYPKVNFIHEDKFERSRPRARP